MINKIEIVDKIEIFSFLCVYYAFSNYWFILLVVVNIYFSSTQIIKMSIFCNVHGINKLANLTGKVLVWR